MTTTQSEYRSASLTRVTTRLALYVAAETAILNGAQSYSIGNRTLTRADLDYIGEMIDKLETKQMKLARNGAIRVQRVVPRDM